ncbi:hypothetical protein vseg_007347 [Gypsophila vaccaria]
MKLFPKHPIYFLLILFTTLIILPITHTNAREHPKIINNAHNDLITAMCQKTPYPSTCETNLRADPRSTKADSTNLILIFLDVIKSRFSDSLVHAKDMSKSTTDPKMIRALTECVSEYSVVANDNVKTAIYAVKTGNPKFALQAMDDARIEADACKNGFDGNVPPYFGDRTRELDEISAIASTN